MTSSQKSPARPLTRFIRSTIRPTTSIRKWSALNTPDRKRRTGITVFGAFLRMPLGVFENGAGTASSPRFVSSKAFYGDEPPLLAHLNAPSEMPDGLPDVIDTPAPGD